MARMATYRAGATDRRRLLSLLDRIAGDSRNARVTIFAIAVVVVAAIVAGIMRGERVAAWAPVDVVSSHEPLQELPIRVAGHDGVVRPAHTHDAVLDMKSISSLVVGVDLHVLPKGAERYEAVIRTDSGHEMFRGTIAPDYFKEGRFMLRLFPKHFPNGEYFLEIEAVRSETDKRVVAASWFQALSS